MSHRQSIEIPVIRRLLNRVAGSRTDKNGVAAIDETFGVHIGTELCAVCRASDVWLDAIDSVPTRASRLHNLRA